MKQDNPMTQFMTENPWLVFSGWCFMWLALAHIGVSLSHSLATLLGFKDKNKE